MPTINKVEAKLRMAPKKITYETMLFLPQDMTDKAALERDHDSMKTYPFVFCVFDATFRKKSSHLRRTVTESSINGSKKASLGRKRSYSIRRHGRRHVLKVEGKDNSIFECYSAVGAVSRLEYLHTEMDQFLTSNYPRDEYSSVSVGVGYFTKHRCMMFKFDYDTDGVLQVYHVLLELEKILD